MACDGPDPTPLWPPPAPMGALPCAPRPGGRPLAGTKIALTDRTSAMKLDPAVAHGFDRGAAVFASTDGRRVAPGDDTREVGFFHLVASPAARA